METGEVRKHLLHAIAAAKQRAQERRQQSEGAARDYATFLQVVAAPMVQQIANALRAEGYAFTASTPGDSVRLTYDRGRDDFVELSLDNSGDRPEVVGRISQSRGSRRLDEERPVKPGVPPSALTDQHVLEFFMQALEPWLAR